METVKNFLCHGCNIKYKYDGDYREFIGKKCKHCGFVVWTQEEQELADKVDGVKTPLELMRLISTFTPLEQRLFQYWGVAIKAAGDVQMSNENIMDTLE